MKYDSGDNVGKMVGTSSGRVKKKNKIVENWKSEGKKNEMK